MERELRGCFDFFWNEWVSDPASPTYGMFDGDYIGYDTRSPLVIEEQGLYFMAIITGVERGYITRQQGQERILTALKSIDEIENINGFYWHFIDRDTGEKGWDKSIAVDLTNDGTSIMIIGALIAGEYFGGEIEKLADEIYERANWKWFTNPQTHFPYLTCYPDGAPDEASKALTNDEGFLLDWGMFGHHTYLYIIAAGAPNPEFRTGDKGYYTIEEERGSYGDGEEFIFCRLGASFNYQWSQLYFDFRNMEDKKGRNWFENAKHAAIAARVDKAGTRVRVAFGTAALTIARERVDVVWGPGSIARHKAALRITCCAFDVVFVKNDHCTNLQITGQGRIAGT